MVTTPTTSADPIRRPAPSSDLASDFELIKRIKEQYAAITEATRNIVARAIDLGETLIETKAKRGHGNFLEWVKTYCGISDKTAERYMKLAENKAKLTDAKIDTMSNLTLTDALRLVGVKTGGGASTATPLDRFENAWSKLDIPTQQAFVEANYNDLAKLMKEIDRKSKAAA